MVDDHSAAAVKFKEAELFKGYAQAGEDTRTRAFAAELLPTLQAHLDR